MPKGGRLTIETKRIDLDEEYADRHLQLTPGAYVLLSISDNGEGMGKDIIEQIFEPFFTTKEMGKGTGLGLATVYGIVKQSEGHIFVYSEEGLGTTFKIYLPRVEEEAYIRHLPRTDDHGGGTESVLIVEDEASLRGMAKRILEEAGYRVQAVANGADALQALGQNADEVHLILTDVVMPGIGGRELAEMATQLRPGLKVVYMTGYTDDALARHGVLADSAHVITKPFTADELTRKIREVLDLPRM